MRSIGCVSIFLASCCGCCVLRVPTFGLGPDVDEEAIRAAILAEPFLVKRFCRTDLVCDEVDAATIEVVPVGWSVLEGEAITLVAVEATCRGSDSKLQRIEPFVCAGVLAAGVAAAAEGATARVWLTDDLLLPVDPAHVSEGGGDWDDWD